MMTCPGCGHPEYRHPIGRDGGGCLEPGCPCPHWNAPPVPDTPAWDPDVEQALEAIGEQVGAAVTPLAVTLQETRQALVRMTPLYADLRDTLEAVLDVCTRAGLSPSWVQDREILDHARDLIARTAPNGAPDATPPTDPGTPAG